MIYGPDATLKLVSLSCGCVLMEKPEDSRRGMDACTIALGPGCPVTAEYASAPKEPRR